MLISLTATTAADINNTVEDTILTSASNVDTISASINTEENNNDTQQSINEESLLSAGNDDSGNNILGANEQTGSYNDLALLIRLASSGETLNIYQDYTYGGTSDINSINITKTLTIDFNGRTINGNSNGRGFIVTADNVIIKNVKLINCKATSFV